MEHSRTPQIAANPPVAPVTPPSPAPANAVPSTGRGPVTDPWRWDHLRQRCLREASRILRRREDAEEAAQEALLRAWRLRDRCRHPESRAAWVAKIARNEALRLHARRQAQPHTTALLDEAEPITALPGGPAIPAGEAELLDRLSWQDALAALAPEDRALVTLCYVGDITQAALAGALGLPEVSVRVRLHRIRNRLGQVIGPGQ